MKRSKFIVILLILGVGYGTFLFFMGMDKSVGEKPELSVPSSVLKISVKDQEKVLLKDVQAIDNEDGELTSEVFIENISQFDENKRRTVTYAVFDSDDHLVRKTRQIQYTDYKEPVISLKKALCYYYVTSMNEFKHYVVAKSNVDGDISSQVSVDKVYYEDEQYYVNYSVTDSCGTKVSLRLKADALRQEPNIEINLSKYLIRVAKGTSINPHDYIKNIKIMGMKDNSLKSAIEIQNDYNPNVPGTYEFIYRISRSNGDYGITKLVVIVE